MAEKQDHFWLKITLFIQGNLKEKLFYKTLTLMLNQTIADYLIQLHLTHSVSNLGISSPESKKSADPNA